MRRSFIVEVRRRWREVRYFSGVACVDPPHPIGHPSRGNLLLLPQAKLMLGGAEWLPGETELMPGGAKPFPHETELMLGGAE